MEDLIKCGVRSGSTLFAYVKTLDSMLILIKYKLELLQANCGDPDQTTLAAGSPLGLVPC